jgi:ABC-2 type transport system ATP-binding protein
MIRVVGVSKTYHPARRQPVHAVRDVSIDVRPGEVTGLLGPNGAGKTTLIRMMTSYLTPSSGAISVCGHDSVEDAGAARRHIGYLPESAPLYPEMRVEDYLSYRAQVFGVARAARASAVGAAVERCALVEMRRRRIGQLSKGYRQRVGLAAAILHDPDVLILDEPTSGLDPTQIREMRSLIRDLAGGASGDASGSSGGRSRVVLLSSHILPEVEHTCDRVVIVARGQVRADATPRGLLEQRQDDAHYDVEVVALQASASGERFDAGAIERAALAATARVDGVREARVVARVDDGVRLTIEPTPGAGDLREALSRAVRSCVEPSLLVRELSVRRASLEAVFMRAVESSGDDAREARDGSRAEAGATR